VITFKYKAIRSKDGKIVTGEFQGINAEEVKQNLKLQYLIPIKIKENKTIDSYINGSIFIPTLSTKVLSLFCRQLGIILSSGINIIRGLEIIEVQISDKNIKKIISKLLVEVAKGNPLSQAFISCGNKIAPILLIKMLEVGESTGKLDIVLDDMANYYESEMILMEKFKKALYYPVILAILGIVMFMFFTSMVLPEMQAMLKDSEKEIPFFTTLVFNSVDVIKKASVYIIGISIFIFLILKKFLSKETFEFYKDSILLNIPLLNKSIKNMVTARFLKSASMMIECGISIIETFEILEKLLGNAIAKKCIRSSIDGMKIGEPIDKTLSSYNFFDSMVIDMIAVGIETGELTKIMETTYDYYIKQSEIYISKLIAMAEPIFTIIIGVVLSTIIMAVTLPIFGMLPG